MIFVVSIPVMVINFFYSYNNKDILFNYVNKEEVNNEENSVSIRVLRSNGNIETMDLEDYLVGVVPSESPLYFEDEALKAQAVAARTYANYKINHSTKTYDLLNNISDQGYITKEEMQEKWQDKNKKGSQSRAFFNANFLQ